ncbi:MAG: type II secretion system F family protein [Candidatus Eremiobacteraeota bacterium]|nr:type II secretion system F family protein [Candidatus Eremiobacteraeota bacterium]MCW5866094.1 type II secretion system F family protein [Candidatus Eremiobacteraeota bacterium]
MPLYEYRAHDAAGKEQKGFEDAPSSSAAYQQLKARGLFPSHLQENSGQGSRGIGDEGLAHLVTQLASLLKSGIPVDEALESLSLSEGNPNVRSGLQRVRVRLREGQTLAGALAQENLFPRILLRMVEAGEESGKLPMILQKFADYLQRDLANRQALAGALTYPIILVSISILLLGGLLYFLTPVLREMYGSLGIDPPMFTKVMLWVGGWMVDYGAYVLPAVILLALGIFRWIPAGLRQSITLRLPLWGQMLLAALLERWCSTLAMLHGAGVPLVRALQLSREVMQSPTLDQGLQQVERAVERGDGISNSVSRLPWMPPLLQQFLRTGERTGDLEAMLESASHYYERELERRRSLVLRFLEPALITAMGVVVGFLVLAVLLPLSDVSSRLNI